MHAAEDGVPAERPQSFETPRWLAAGALEAPGAERRFGSPGQGNPAGEKSAP